MKLLDRIGSAKTKLLKPKAVIKTILKFMRENLSDEVYTLADELRVLVPHPCTEEHNWPLFLAIKRKYKKVDTCYQCYVQRTNRPLAPGMYIEDDTFYCSECGETVRTIRVLEGGK